MTNIIINHFRELGFNVTVRRIKGAVEMHAIPINGKGPRQVARCNDGDGTEHELKCACMLARTVGVDFDL